MPILNREDAAEVEAQFKSIFAADPSRRADELRKLFVERLDFEPASRSVSLAGAPKSVQLPAQGERLAAMSGVTAVYVHLVDSQRVNKREAAAAAKLISDEVGDILLVVTNSSSSQVHFIYPTFEGAKPSLRRLIVEGDNYLRRTAIEQFTNFYFDWIDTKDIRGAFERLFDVEAVTTRFFQKYKSVFDSVIEKVQGFGPGEDEQESKKLFVQTLFNRLMFVYFLSRKGWLTFNGDKDYLNALWKDYPARSEDKNFYNSRLKTLFFAGLNNYRSADLSTDPLREVIGDVPFLNGGLFDDKDTLDNRPGILVPDDAIGMILADLFDKFNFTVMESTPLDVEVAVDPEMLGKVFEELVTGRHETGSYYTPRPVVAFMCREALKGYLGGKNTGATEEAIRSFVDDRDSSGLSMSTAPHVGAALAKVRVVDPACGSGAYLLGMLQELVDLQTALYSDQLSHQAKDLYGLKLQIIQDSLYGADIDEFAVNIAMLRLWLSLAIDYEGIRPEPLPNLDFKVVCGDSLTSPNPSPENYGDLFRHRIEELADQLADLKHDHMSATGQMKVDLAAEIDVLLGQLRDAVGESPAPIEAVDWRVEFAEVFSQNGGFDIAIANPPYVRYQDIGSGLNTLRSLHQDATTGRSDLYCYFYARALQLLRSAGVHVFVCSNSWLDSGYGEHLQRFLLERAHIVSIYQSEVERQFSTAEINTLISVIVKNPPQEAHLTCFVSLLDEFNEAIADALKCREAIVRRSELWNGVITDEVSALQGSYNGGKWGGQYLRAPSVFRIIVERAKDKCIRVGSIVDVNEGKPTGANDFFFVPRDVAAEFGIEDEFLHPGIMKTRGMARFVVKGHDLDRMLFATNQKRAELAGTHALEYIRSGENEGLHLRRTFANRDPWYSLTVRRPADLLLPCGIGSTFFCAHNHAEAITSNSFTEFRLSDKSYTDALWLWFNSVVGWLQVELLGRSSLGGGMLKVDPTEYRQMFVINKAVLHHAVPQLDRDILTVQREIYKADRRKLDDIIFEILGLTVAEQDGVYEALEDLVNKRIIKAGTV